MSTRSRGQNGHKWRQVTALALRQWKKRIRLECHLCLDEIALDLPPRSDFSLSYDHYLPVSTHPELEYTLGNLRPCHAICNRTRQARPAEDIYADRESFRRLVDNNLERRAIKRATAERASAAIATGTASSRHWCGAWQDSQGRNRPPFCLDDCPWRPENAATRDSL